MSIVEALLDAVRQEKRAYPGAQVQIVRVRVGALRQIVPDTLKFCFQAATRDTDLAGVLLELDQIPARARCRNCRAEFAVEDNWFQCPHCAAADGELLTGNELDLTSIELRNPPDRLSASV